MARQWGNEFRRTTVCIDRYDGRIPAGRLQNRFLESDRPFCGVVEFFSEMERILNTLNFPQSFTAVRSFQRTEHTALETGPPDQAPPRGRLATFTVQVLFRQNASWQGSVSWLEGRAEESFRSALELVFLMDSVLRGQAGEPK